MTKRFKGSLLALTLSAAVLSGCTGNSGEQGNASSPSNQSQTGGGTSAAGEGSGKISAEPFTASIFYYDKRFQITGDMPVFKKAAELTNVSLQNVAPTGGEDQQAYNLMLASGELPDIISYKSSDLNAVALEGALQPLDDLIAQHAPNLKKFLEERPDIKKAVTASDGKIYVIPFVHDGIAKEGWFLRKDWLDKLKLSEPKTVEEYYQVLKAFKEQDPNGNGKQDEIPFFSRNPLIGIYGLLPLWDSFHDFYMQDGKVHYGPYEPAYKEGILNLAKWYKEGLIDKEIYTRGNSARDVLFTANTGGAVHDWFASTSNFNQSIAGSVPGFSLLPIAPPASVSGKVQEVSKRDTMNGFGWAISAKAKDPVLLVKYFDFWWSEEGRRMFNFGIEGETYTLVDGKPVFTEEVLKQPSVVDHLYSKYGSQLNIGAWQDFAYEEQWSNKIAIEGIKMYQDNKYINTEFQLPVLNFTPEEQTRLKEIYPPIQTYVSETAQKWVMGGEEIEGSFDRFVIRLKEMGMDEVLTIYQAAYDRYNQQ